MKLQVDRNTSYFAIKDSIFGAIRYFQKKKSENTVLCECTSKEGNFEIEINRSVIASYLGYDFRLKKTRFGKETKPNGKLYHKIQILNLYTEIIESQLLLHVN